MGDRHRFGAARHHSNRMSAPSGGRSSGGPHHQNTEAFDRVADRSRPPGNYQRQSWEETHNDFDFGSEPSHERARDDRPQREPGVVTNRAPKYQSSGRVRASGQSVAAPGSSIINTNGDGVLETKFIPPKKQDEFITGLMTKKNTALNRGIGAQRLGSSLEAASAPAPKRVDSSTPPITSSGWHKRPAPGNPKPRLPLRAAEKRRTSPPKRQRFGSTSLPQRSRYELRDRDKLGLSSLSRICSDSFTIRNNPRPTRLGKRRNSTEGSAAEPIALDSDSDSDVEAKADSSNNAKSTISTNGSTDAKVILSDEEEDQKVAGRDRSAAVDLKQIESSSIAKIRDCDVMIGLFQCVANLFFQNDRVCLSSIRGKYEEWPFKSYYLLDYEKLRDVRLYGIAKDFETDVAMGTEEPERIEQLVDEASFLVFKCPMPEAADRIVMKGFYDPTASDDTKSYMMLRPLEDASGDTDLEGIKDILRSHADIVSIDSKERAKKYLQNLVNEPFSYRAIQRRKRRRNKEGEVESSSESDDESSERNAPVLTYPLPPCTSDIVTIIRRDVSRLKPRRYLNDNIIDYYFKRMILEDYRDNELVQEKVLFLSSHFYSRLRAGKGSTSTARLETGYKNVSTWLARSKFFDRSIIFIPINKDLHWSLAIILNPRLAATGDQANDDNDEAFSCIAVLDPLGSYHRKAAIVRNLRMFLRLEWENYKCRLSEDVKNALPEYAPEGVLSVKVKAPQQQNGYDCGVYVLKFAEVILRNCVELELLGRNEGVIGKDVTDDNLEPLISSNEFLPEDISAKRKEVHQHIEEDAIEYRRLLEQKKAAKPAK